jgi:murein DD-endopeptidase MepM/ murein hydrolase activator NlpD
MGIRKTILGTLAVLLVSSAPALASLKQEKQIRPDKQYRAASAAVKKPKMVRAPYASRVLRTGMAGTDVLKLQRHLVQLQLPATPDAVFGPVTRKAVVAFERSRKIPVDGVVQRKEAKRIQKVAKRKRVPTGPYLFPVAGPHTYGGPDATFGAPRGGHTHEGQDVLANCGVPLVAAQGGTVRANAFQAAGAGFYTVIKGSLNGEDYMYAHMSGPGAFGVGVGVAAGQQIGVVGATGDATGCHLHFEIWTVPGWYTGGYPYDPLPQLQTWDNYS